VEVDLRPFDADVDNERLADWLTDERILEHYEDRETPYPATPLVITADGAAVGYAQHFPVAGPLRAEYHLDDVHEVAGLERVDAVELFVDPDRWGEGIGAAALTKVLERLFAEGIDGVVVDPQVSNERAQRLYERHGFRWVAYLSPDTALMVARPPGVEGPRQRVPRPPGARVGLPAPWADVPVELRTGVRVDHVRAALDRVGSLETFAAPYGRVRAAVLIALFEEDGEARVVLTRRSSSMRSHRGEVSFPGGRIEVDETPVQAALREADEEVGIDPASAEVLGELMPLATMSSSSSITPFVAVLPSRPELRPNPGEVELAFDVALADLLADGVFREERWDFPFGPDRPVYFFDLPADLIWGATARILHELLALVVTERTGPPPPAR
jgi:8-oxo-dGTP pyrophosphatase MutT (NUDIX family)/ribosomal protein S18 acetylase RimI-like enzyme